MNKFNKLLTVSVFFGGLAAQADALAQSERIVVGNEISIAESATSAPPKANSLEVIKAALEDGILTSQEFLGGTDSLQKALNSLIEKAQQYSAGCKRINGELLMSSAARAGYQKACDEMYSLLKDKASIQVQSVDSLLAFADKAKLIIDQNTNVLENIQMMEGFSGGIGELEKVATPLNKAKNKLEKAME